MCWYVTAEKCGLTLEWDKWTVMSTKSKLILLFVILILSVLSDGWNPHGRFFGRRRYGGRRSINRCNRNRNCICTYEYRPVCCNGKTYENKCAANCACAKYCRPGACGYRQ